MNMPYTLLAVSMKMELCWFYIQSVQSSVFRLHSSILRTAVDSCYFLYPIHEREKRRDHREKGGACDGETWVFCRILHPTIVTGWPLNVRNSASNLREKLWTAQTGPLHSQNLETRKIYFHGVMSHRSNTTVFFKACKWGGVGGGLLSNSSRRVSEMPLFNITEKNTILMSGRIFQHRKLMAYL